MTCNRPPRGWHCIRQDDHAGPCAAFRFDDELVRAEAETAFKEACAHLWPRTHPESVFAQRMKDVFISGYCRGRLDEAVARVHSGLSVALEEFGYPPSAAHRG